MKLKFPTLSYKYDEEEEYIFCVKSRPFPVLVSSKLPATEETLLDYDMVRELGLRMKELQCKRFSYAGYQMRVFGTVTTTVQCIQDGEMCGTTTIRADVIQNLAKNLSVECVASQRLSSQLQGKNCNSSGAPSTPRASPKSKPKPKPSPKTPTPPTSPVSRASSSPATRGSPPGFPKNPQYSPPRAGLLRAVSPLTANVRKLETMFAKADLQPDGEAEMDTLFDHDIGGDLEVDDKTSAMTFYRTDGPHYVQGHGRAKCTPGDCDVAKRHHPPYNCGYNRAVWQYPEKFRPCGHNCTGAFCDCLQSYK